MNCNIVITKGDITTQAVDAIVNTAHSDLFGGDGVDGAIHSAAGSELLAECRRLEGCAEGEAKITGGYNLPCKYVIHTVCPQYSGAIALDEFNFLKHCFINSLCLAYKNGCRTVAFPAIGCGHKGFPADVVAKIAMRTIKLFLEDHPDMLEVRIVCHPDEHIEEFFQTARHEVFGKGMG